jgi:hypothetical protein
MLHSDALRCYTVDDFEQERGAKSRKVLASRSVIADTRPVNYLILIPIPSRQETAPCGAESQFGFVVQVCWLLSYSRCTA